MYTQTDSLYFSIESTVSHSVREFRRTSNIASLSSSIIIRLSIDVSFCERNTNYHMWQNVVNDLKADKIYLIIITTKATIILIPSTTIIQIIWCITQFGRLCEIKMVRIYIYITSQIWIKILINRTPRNRGS